MWHVAGIESIELMQAERKMREVDTQRRQQGEADEERAKEAFAGVGGGGRQQGDFWLLLKGFRWTIDAAYLDRSVGDDGIVAVFLLELRVVCVLAVGCFDGLIALFGYFGPLVALPSVAA